MIFLALKHSDIVFILLINVKTPTIVGVLTFISRINFILSELSMKNVLYSTCVDPGIFVRGGFRSV